MIKKNIIVVTGGEGFIGSNIIEYFLNKTNYFIISIDNNYSKSNIKIKSKRVKYIKSSTSHLAKKLDLYKNKINSIFHFGEFSRIAPSFKYYEDCLNFNFSGTGHVLKFCIQNNIRIIYSASSSIFGNYGLDQNLSPYSWSKAKNIELIKNFSKWFGLKYEIAYFYNVYGKNQIGKGKMASVIGIFENQYKSNKDLTIVKPGNQKRDFTHISDIVRGVYLVWKKGKQKEYLLKYHKSYSVESIAKMFKHKYVYINERAGERFKSHKVNNNNAKKILNFKAKVDIKDYITKTIKKINV